ncbi:MAG: hypothetical protein PHU25_01080 [Deltaproteobacteria bacterium]|nr:hypothetical protein [Deltaproteobacteria bacterium]
MAKSILVANIQEAASEFAMEIVKAIQGATFQEIVALQGGVAAPQVRRGRPPKAKGKKTGKKLGRPPKAVKALKAPKAVNAPKAPAKKKRIVKNYPKCAFPSCGKNRFVRGKGFCGKHWKAFEAGKIKDAASYKSAKKGKAK